MFLQRPEGQQSQNLHHMLVDPFEYLETSHFLRVMQEEVKK